MRRRLHQRHLRHEVPVRLWALVLSLAFACHKDTPPSVHDAGPPPPKVPPVNAELLDVPAHVAVAGPCDQHVVVSTSGGASALGETLAENDALIAMNQPPFEVRGTGKIAHFTVIGYCDATPSPWKKVVRAVAPEIAWEGGHFRAHLDNEGGGGPYVGRLWCDVAIKEHAHEESWEALCATEGAGTFTLEGTPRRFVAPACVAIPQGTKHAFVPDPGTQLRAAQLYAPPGPEQRFKTFAAH